MGRSWTRRRFLVTGGRVAAGAAAVGVGGTVLAPDGARSRVTAGAAGQPGAAGAAGAAGMVLAPDDLDPVALAVAMIRFDTSHNGEGGVTRAHADWFAAKWAAAGVETEIVPTPKADNVHCIARIRGNGTAPPLLFLGHSDVVSVDRPRWTVDPFGGEVRDGFVYGRGAIDMKGANAATMAALLRHLSEGATFDRDVIFVSDCDEEGGPYGGRWLAANHWDKVEAGAVLTEGGWFLAQRDGTTPMLATLTCQDKAFALVEVTAEGTTTHSSRPQPDSAIVRLNRAVARLGDYQPDVVVSPLTRRHFEAVAEATDDRSLARAIRLMLRAERRAERNRAGRVVVSRSPFPWLHNALMRPTLAFVIEQGGYKTNVIPGGAKAVVNVRFVPGGTGVEQIVAEMRASVADEKVTVAHVGVLPGETPEAATERVGKSIAATPSPYPEASGAAADATGVFAAWESAVTSVFPGAGTAPTLFEAGTATAGWRARGIPVYGVYPYVVNAEEMERMHGDDERVGVEALRRSADLMYELFARFRV